MLFHSAFFKVDDTTYLGRLFILLAQPAGSSGIDGQAFANPSGASTDQAVRALQKARFFDPRIELSRRGAC